MLGTPDEIEKLELDHGHGSVNCCDQIKLMQTMPKNLIKGIIPNGKLRTSKVVLVGHQEKIQKSV